MIDFKKMLKENARNIEIYCDGAIKGVKSKGTKYGGLGIIPVEDNIFDYLAIPYIGEDLTNNKLEILSVLFSIMFAMDSCNHKGKININIKSDSQYVVNSYNKYIDNWIENGWKTNSGSDVKNIELWELMNRIKSYVNRNRYKYYIDVQWTKGHSNEKYNDLADEYAVKAKMEAIENNDSAFSIDYAIDKANKFITKLEKKEVL